MGKIYKCGTCGVITEARQQICDPGEVENKRAYCGTAPESGQMCTDIKAHLAYVCGSCGRPAEQAELLCKPLLTG